MINIINAAQENSPITVVQALDKVLEILRSSELYSPFLSPAQARDDPMTSDLVGGLMTTVRGWVSNMDVGYTALIGVGVELRWKAKRSVEEKALSVSGLFQ